MGRIDINALQRARRAEIHAEHLDAIIEMKDRTIAVLSDKATSLEMQLSATVIELGESRATIAALNAELSDFRANEPPPRESFHDDIPL